MHKCKALSSKIDVVEVVALLTNGHEGLGVEAGLRHANAVDGKDSHLIQDALDHPLGLVRCRLVDVKVELGPSAGTFLLPLHEITCPSRALVREIGRRSEGGDRILACLC